VRVKEEAMATRTISQEAFEELVKENVDDLGMDPMEALQDAIQTLTLQGVDLSGSSLSSHLLTFSIFQSLNNVVSQASSPPSPATPTPSSTAWTA